MNLAALLLLHSAVAVAGQCTSKLSSIKIANNGSLSYNVFLIINSIIGCFYFWITAGFIIKINLVTFLFSLLYAVGVLLSLYSNFKVLQLVAISDVQIISNSCYLISTVCLGFILFNEKPTIIKFIRLGLMLIAFIIIFSGNHKKMKPKSGFLPVLSGLILAQILNFITLKYYSRMPKTTNNNSFFFLTNLVLLFGSCIWLLAKAKSSSDSLKQYKSLFKLSTLIPFASNTICSNTSSLINLLLISKMEASILTPVTSALGIICGIVSSLIFREKRDLRSYIAGAIAIVSIVI